MANGSGRRIELPANTDLLGLHARAPTRYPFLLQSTSGPGALGQYDILFTAADDVIDSNDGDFFARLDDAFQAERSICDDTLPFSGGWFLYLGYELAGDVEPSLSLQADALLPSAFAVRCRAAVIRHRDTQATVLVCEDDLDRGFEEQLRSDIASLNWTPGEPGVLHVEEDPPAEFLDAVRTAKRHIEAGSVYQANLSRAWRVTLDSGTQAADVYRSLTQANPAPFSGIARYGETSIISSSPERLLRLANGIAETRPIAGTRPRSDDKGVDAALSDELIAHPKERAEHVMLIDLERNDLGRFCKPGSVEVDEFMVIESYAHVHHIVSNVRGVPGDNTSPSDAIRAVFPGGTITGCPKVRCMQIISELETGPRGAYTGAFGYLNIDGSLDLNILIRTMVMQGNTLSFRAGSGIVADSEPEHELLETRAKAKGMLKALGE
ncbi:MAG: aminodeoxychorismate synthase component I [Pseudomonadota bacterium]